MSNETFLLLLGGVVLVIVGIAVALGPNKLTVKTHDNEED